MSVGVTFAHPNSIFISEGAINSADFNQGDPIEIHLEDADRPICGQAKLKQDLDLNKERHAMFFTIPDVYSDLPDSFEHLSGAFEERGGQIGRSTLDIGTPEKFQIYLDFMKKVVDKRSIKDADVVIGNGLLQYMSDSISREDLIHNQLVQCSRSRLLEVLDGETPNIEEIGRYQGRTIEPAEIFICTNTFNFTPENRRNLVSDIVDLKYLMPFNLLFPTPEGAAHGPISKKLAENPKVPEPSERDREPLLRVSEDNIRVTSVYISNIHQHTKKEQVEVPDKLLFDSILAESGSINTEMEIKSRRSGRSVVEFDNYVNILFQDSDEVDFLIEHPTKTELSEITAFLRQVKRRISENLDGDTELHLHQSRNHPPETARHKKWFLDTNSIYRQTNSGEKSPVDEFLLNVQHIYGKEINIPVEALIEINRHKDEGDGKRSLSKRGMKNISILQKASDFGLIDFSVANLPTEFDERIHPDTGATDFAILEAAKDSGILITNDQYLLSISSFLSIPSIDISNVTEIDHGEVEEKSWTIAKDIVRDREVSKNQLISHITSEVNGPNQDSLDRSDVEGLVASWIDSNEILRGVDEGAENISISKEVSVVPTYSVAMEIAEKMEEPGFSDGKYIPTSVLESMRKCVGGLQKHVLPHVEFVLPESYIYRAEQVSQIGELYKLTQAENAEYRCVSIGAGTDLEQAAVKLAKSHELFLVCSDGNESIYKMSNLLGVNAGRIRI